MASRKPPAPPAAEVPIQLLVERTVASGRLTERIGKGKQLMELARVSTDVQRDFDIWNAYNNEMLGRIFSGNKLTNEYAGQHIYRPIRMDFYGGGRTDERGELVEDIQCKVQALESILHRLELYSEMQSEVSSQVAASEHSSARSNKVFLVHGHDGAAKANLEVFLRDIGLDPVVLHRQADEGLTLIEKLEKNSEVGYAFILLTPDEIAYVNAEQSKPDGERHTEKRARPNVIFEFGYFVGKLSRSRVCCLHTGGVSVPSDLHGIVYKVFSNSIEEVAYGIVKDLQKAGYNLTV